MFTSDDLFNQEPDSAMIVLNEEFDDGIDVVVLNLFKGKHIVFRTGIYDCIPNFRSSTEDWKDAVCKAIMICNMMGIDNRDIKVIRQSTWISEEELSAELLRHKNPPDVLKDDEQPGLWYLVSEFNIDYFSRTDPDPKIECWGLFEENAETGEWNDVLHD